MFEGYKNAVGRSTEIITYLPTMSNLQIPAFAGMTQSTTDQKQIAASTAERMTAADYLFLFSRLACLFSLAVFCGCFFLSFFVSWDLDMAHLLVMCSKRCEALSIGCCFQSNSVPCRVSERRDMPGVIHFEISDDDVVERRALFEGDWLGLQRVGEATGLLAGDKRSQMMQQPDECGRCAPRGDWMSRNRAERFHILEPEMQVVA